MFNRVLKMENGKFLKQGIMREYLRTNHLFSFTSESGGNGLTNNYS